jgi:Ca-activated chloride channel family protein
MQHRTCLALLAFTLLAACQSNPAAYQEIVTEPAPPHVVDSSASLDSVIVTGSNHAGATQKAERTRVAAPPPATTVAYAPTPMITQDYYTQPANTENYAHHDDNPVHRTSEQPVSTFSIDVDTGSYSNVRRMLRQGTRPPTDAVRAEEFLNYFHYNHPAPASREIPFRVTTELAAAPWNAQRQLLMIGIKGYDVPKTTLPPANLVFLIDTSGSMNTPDRLPLVKQSLRMLAEQLRPQDHVSIVVYAGSAGLVLPPTSGANRAEILAALNRLEAGGSTNGGDGIRLAYAVAKQAYVEGGVNRVILATDGDFNVGTVNQNALETLVADQRKSGIALTTLGFGTDNYNDALAVRLADIGNGNHAYIDSVNEARKVLVEQMQSTLLTIANDVKIQIEFNPAQVAEYRLIGYEKRLLAREDFANDKVDAGDIGAGHEVTALYEIVPAGSSAQRLPPLRYADTTPAADAHAGELAHLRLRYKLPGTDASRLIETPIRSDALTAQPGDAFRFASAVVAWADLLRGGTHIDGWGWNEVTALARGARGEDYLGLRSEFAELVAQSRRLAVQDREFSADE